MSRREKREQQVPYYSCPTTTTTCSLDLVASRSLRCNTKSSGVEGNTRLSSPVVANYGVEVSPKLHQPHNSQRALFSFAAQSKNEPQGGPPPPPETHSPSSLSHGFTSSSPSLHLVVAYLLLPKVSTTTTRKQHDLHLRYSSSASV